MTATYYPLPVRAYWWVFFPADVKFWLKALLHASLGEMEVKIGSRKL